MDPELGSAVSPCLVLISWPHILSLRSESQTPDTNITLAEAVTTMGRATALEGWILFSCHSFHPIQIKLF